MAITESNGLYPPLIETYAPAFIQPTGANGVRIYFSLSPYNNYSRVTRCAQISLRDQKTNFTVLNEGVYPQGIKIMDVGYDQSVTSDAKYYITLYNNDLRDGQFNINTRYKLQIRFTDNDATTSTDVNICDDFYNNYYSDSKTWSTWLNNNLANFSEWSTVCLIRAISTPSVALTGLTYDEVQSTWVSDGLNLSILGTLSFADEEETDTLSSCSLYLRDEYDNDIEVSGVLSPNNGTDVMQFSYTFRYMLTAGESYHLHIEYTTAEGYTTESTMAFIAGGSLVDIFTPTIAAVPNAEKGYVDITVTIPALENDFAGKLYIKRTQSINDLTYWDTLFIIPLNLSASEEERNFAYRDLTAESGDIYKYGVQYRQTSTGNFSNLFQTEPFIIQYEYSSIVSDGKMLILKLNEDLSSYKHNLVESAINTIGSKYPYIQRNGNVDYRTFSISGLISFWDDTDFPETKVRFWEESNPLVENESMFVSKMELFTNNQGYVQMFENYNSENGINQFNDVVYERRFREAVVNFLKDGKPKLIKTPQEGNILVRLMSPTLTPLDGTSTKRYLYTFTCEAYEISEPDIESLQKLGIQTKDVTVTDASSLTWDLLGVYTWDEANELFHW